ncbi:hypothetical protein B4U84_29830 [Westiellopsis prolifica IICB1]|nr:hypothetical protein B4U84_30030 [Westiellopsis prolifica IICB1]TBR56424.1 hypothetical protein B4U84_29830 [Westiellopsis prolifica IICB1]
MTEERESEQRDIKTESGNYNESIEGDYVQGNVFKWIINILGGQQRLEQIENFALIKKRSILSKKWYYLLILFISSLGLTLTYFFILNNQKQTALLLLILMLLLLMFLNFTRIFILVFIERITQNFERKQQELANNLADEFERKLDPWEQKSLIFQTKYYHQLIESCRDYRTQGLKTKGPFTLDLEKVFVPLKVAPESAEQIHSAMISLREKVESTSIWDWLVASQNIYTFRSIVIIGPPGSGKTTLLEHLALIYAKNEQRKQHSKATRLIPILLYLRDVQEMIVNSELSLSELIEQQQLIKKLNPPKYWFERNLQLDKDWHTQQCLVMLDGLDEVSFNKRTLISQWINKQIQEYRHVLFLLTSRPFGYRSAPIRQVRTVLEVQPFNLKQMQTFIQNWYLQNEIMSRLGQEDQGVRQMAQTKSNDLIERIKNNPSLAAMAVNPLLLTMIATIHSYRGALPGRRVELYAEICDVMLGRRQEFKGIPDSLSAKQKKVVLQVLALELMEQNTRDFSPESGSCIIQAELAKLVENNLKPEAFIENIENVCGLLVEREKDEYEFAHKSFQEYLAAVQIKEANKEQFLISKINNDWWHETIRLYAAQSNATNIIRTALANPTVVSLKLAFDCQEEGLKVEPEVRQQLTEKLEAGLESNDLEIFKLAAEVKLARRLSNLVRVDENLEIDNNYITCAEYQLFLEETHESRQPQHWQTNRFIPGDAKKPITGISWQNAYRFCAWLTLWSIRQGFDSQLNLSELAAHYRLATEDEIKQHYIDDDKQFSENGIRIVKSKLPSKYSQLVYYLMSGEWQKADQETAKVMLEVAERPTNSYLDTEDIKAFPCADLCIIDQLWVYASKGHFGFSVQKRIYQSMGGLGQLWNNEKTWNAFCEHTRWRRGEMWLYETAMIYNLDAPWGHLPSPCWGWWAYPLGWLLLERIEACGL